jgi:putative spermidine/putrescine transport system substrate-binding protein
MRSRAYEGPRSIGPDDWRHGLNRRQLLLGGGTLALTGGRAGRALAAPSVIKIGAFAGLNTEVVREIAVPAFNARYPRVAVEVTSRGAVDAYPRLLVSPNNPIENGGMWNNIFSALGTQNGLFRDFSKDFVPHAKDLLPSVQPTYGMGIAVAVQPFGIAYNPKYVQAPTSWLDLFKPDYANKVAVIDNFWDHYIMLARIMGGNERDLAPAMDEWAKHKKNIGAWASSFTQLDELLDKGEMWLAPHWGGFVTGSMIKGLNMAFAWPKEGCTLQSVIIHVTKGSSDEAAEYTQRFFDVWLSPEFQLAYLTKAGLSPSSQAVSIPPKLAAMEGVIAPERLKEKKLVQYDYAYVGNHLTEIRRMMTEKLR